MASSRKSEMAFSLMVVVVLLLQLFQANANDPPICHFNEQDPTCPQVPTGTLGHIVLAHGAGQGEWYWFRLKPILEAAGYYVSTVQFGASVTKNVDSIKNVTFGSYSKPLFDLMECIDHKVLLVGHSGGGLGIAAVMEKYPHKSLGGVFISAYMPDTSHSMSYVLDMGAKYPQDWVDTCITSSGTETWYFFGEKFLETRLYEMASPEVVALMHTQRRPGSFFNNELSGVQLTNENYGSVDRFFIVIEDDKAVFADYQREMIDNFPVKEARFIQSSGHEVMLSRPLELATHLVEIAGQYSFYGGEMKTKLSSIRRGAWWA